MTRSNTGGKCPHSSLPPDYLDEVALLAHDLDPAIVARLLRDTPLTGHGGRPVIAADRLADLLAMLDREEGSAS